MNEFTHDLPRMPVRTSRGRYPSVFIDDVGKFITDIYTMRDSGRDLPPEYEAVLKDLDDTFDFDRSDPDFIREVKKAIQNDTAVLKRTIDVTKNHPAILDGKYEDKLPPIAGSIQQARNRKKREEAADAVPAKKKSIINIDGIDTSTVVRDSIISSSVASKQIMGIGPVIAAGLIANFDIEKANYAGSFLRFAGLDPTCPPKKKGEKMRYSAKVKTLVCFKLGESFIKVSNNPNDVYGHLYQNWRAIYAARDNNMEYAERAAQILTTKNFNKDTDAYKAYASGHLPAAQMYSMARRKPVSLFIIHLYELMWKVRYNCEPPKAWVFEYGGHDESMRVENPLIKIYENRYGKIDLSHPLPKRIVLLDDARLLRDQMAADTAANTDVADVDEFATDDFDEAE